MELFENKRKTVITLRWLLIIALSYLIIFKERGLSLSIEGKSETSTLFRIEPILIPLKRAV